MPPRPLDLGLLKPHDWDKLLAQAWADTKNHSEHNWHNHATKWVHQELIRRQSAFLALAMEPLNYGWCRCSAGGQIVVVQPWSAADYEFDGHGYGCVDLAPPPEAGKLPIPTSFMEWPVSWFDWTLVNSIFDYGLAHDRWNLYQIEDLCLYGRQCDWYWPNRWNQFLDDILCQALYDWPPYPNDEAVLAYRTSRMARPVPTQPTI